MSEHEHEWKLQSTRIVRATASPSLGQLNIPATESGPQYAIDVWRCLKCGASETRYRLWQDAGMHPPIERT